MLSPKRFPKAVEAYFYLTMHIMPQSPQTSRHTLLAALLVAALMLAGLPCRANLDYGSPQRAAYSAIERSRLPQARTAADSLRVYYNLFDLSVADSRSRLADTLLVLARHAGDESSVLDVLRHQANLSFRDHVRLQEIRSELNEFRPSEELTETRLFVDLLALRNRLDSITQPGAIRDELSRRIDLFANEPDESLSGRILQLYGVCVCMEKVTRGEPLARYMTQLDSMVHQFNGPKGAVSNFFHTRAALTYAITGDMPRMLQVNRTLLATIDSMRASYHRKGRIYRNLESHRYNIYRQLLGAYECLSDSELEAYYDSLQSIIDRNSWVASDAGSNPRARSFYLMAKGRYAEALPLLQRCLGNPRNAMYRQQLLTALAEAASRTGNTAVELQARRDLNELLMDRLQDKTLQSLNEYNLFTDINRLTLQKNELEVSQRLSAESSRRRTLISGAIVIVLLALFLILSLWQLRKSRKLTSELGSANRRIRQERDNLRHAKQELTVARDDAARAAQMKTEFVNTMSHEVSAPLNAIMEYTRLIVDCIPPDKARYLDRFARNIEFNSKLILTLVKDVLDSAEIDKGDLYLEEKSVGVINMCNMALNTVFEGGRSSNPDVKVIFNPENNPDVIIRTDEHRAVQVITNLLANADKFTSKGSITLSFQAEAEHNRINFIVTDTGIGIPEGKEEAVFERFRKLDPSSSGVGLGLYIVRRITALLGGDIRVDRGYSRGARFVFTLPLQP